MNRHHSDLPGRRTGDGSPVDLYRLLKPQGESEIIRDILSPGVSILELGCGVGRITHPLVQMGFTVVAVDNSPEMLEFVGAEKVLADIEMLNLKRKFDAVLLMSHLVNVPDVFVRHAMLSACSRHLAPRGIAIIQRHDPEWLHRAKVGFLGDSAGVAAFLDNLIRRGPEIEMTIRWETEDRIWKQSFVVRDVNEHEIERALESAGLKLQSWIGERRTWFSAQLRAV